jgi:poly(3-hydroxybutyrate) depolymerase
MVVSTMRARLCGLALGCAASGCDAVSPTVLIPNDVGTPLEIGMNNTALCKGRTHVHDECSILLDVPPACAGGKSTCPVAFFLHGETGDGKEFARGAKAVSPALHKANWIGVYPTGDGQWNTDSITGNDDVEFVVSLVDHISSLGAFENWLPKMGSPPDGTPGLYVYGTGTGAALAQKLAANAAALLPIRGIWADGAQLLEAPLKSGPGDMTYNQPGVGHKTKPVAQVASHGTKDAVFPYQGGVPKTQHNCSTCKLMTEANSNLVWAKHNGCNTTKPTIDQTVSATYGAGATMTNATMHTFQYALRLHPRHTPVCKRLYCIFYAA